MRIAIAAETVAANEWPSGFHVAAFDAILHSSAARDQDGGGEILAWGDWWPSVESDPEYDEALCFVVLEESTSNLAAFAHSWTTGFIKDIAVHPALRRRGIGRALMKHVFWTLHERGLISSSLKVLSDNPSNAVAFYRSIGMELIT